MKESLRSEKEVRRFDLESEKKGLGFVYSGVEAFRSKNVLGTWHILYYSSF